MSDQIPRKDQYADEETYNANLRDSAEKLGVLKKNENKSDEKVTSVINDTTNKERK